MGRSRTEHSSGGRVFIFIPIRAWRGLHDVFAGETTTSDLHAAVETSDFAAKTSASATGSSTLSTLMASPWGLLEIESLSCWVVLDIGCCQLLKPRLRQPDRLFLHALYVAACRDHAARNQEWVDHATWQHEATVRLQAGPTAPAETQIASRVLAAVGRKAAAIHDRRYCRDRRHTAPFSASKVLRRYVSIFRRVGKVACRLSRIGWKADSDRGAVIQDGDRVEQSEPIRSMLITASVHGTGTAARIMACTCSRFRCRLS
nr:hypothetical protein CFP56_04374 [Quercus suber]